MVCEFYLHRKPIYAHSFLCMLYFKRTTTTRPTHIKESIHCIQDIKLFQFLWSKPRLSHPTWLEGDHATHESSPSCLNHPPSTHTHTSIGSWPTADTSCQMQWPRPSCNSSFCPKVGFFISFCKLGEVRRVSKTREVITQASSSLGSNQVSLSVGTAQTSLPRPSP